MAEEYHVLSIYMRSGSTINVFVDRDKFQYYWEQWTKILGESRPRKLPAITMVTAGTDGVRSFMVVVPDEVEAITCTPDQSDPNDKIRSAMSVDMMKINHETLRVQLEMMRAAQKEQQEGNSWKGVDDDE